jgi:hypothetical protein
MQQRDLDRKTKRTGIVVLAVVITIFIVVMKFI